MSQDYRTYHEGSTHHVFCKAIGGNIIFYSVQDCIFYITLYYHLARKYGIITRAFSIMPNHIHSNEQAPSRKAFVDFHRDLNREFTITYNAEHKRSGTLFMKPFGFAPKTVGKKIRENIAYIVNNAVAGNLADDLDEYRWNLMAYRNTSYPFSSKIALNKASNRLRRSVKMLKYYYSCGLPLTYDRQRVLFKNLSSEEAGQLTDLIISIHNCLDYKAIGRLYNGDVENAALSARTNNGSEHDIPDDYEDYSDYTAMMRIARDNGVDLKTCNFETMPSKELKKLSDIFRYSGFSNKQIRKFLHLGSGKNLAGK